MRILSFVQFITAGLIYLMASGCATTTVYIVRHAEKVNETDSTDLTPAGHERAAALAETLRSAGIDSIFSTPYRRTRQTAEPLARQTGLPIVNYPAQSTQRIVERLQRIRGKDVLVVGHSNTILDLAKGLGTQPTLSKIESGDFDNLLVVRIKQKPLGKSVSLDQRTYGQPTAP